ncbi:MAG: S8 family serine peptidase [Planctomycetota bacterium]
MRSFRDRACPLVLVPLTVALAPLAGAQTTAPLDAAEIRGPSLPTPDLPTFVEGEILVRYVDTAADRLATLRRAVEAEHGLRRLEEIPRLGVVRYRLPVGTSVADALRAMRGDERLDYVEQNGLAHHHQVPNDGFYDNYAGVATDLQKWCYDGVGADRNVNAEAAWDLTTGRSDVVIAVIDSGVERDHPDLAPNMWTNPGEIAGNGVDDDGNGFVDDFHGWDFRSGDNDPNPDYGDGLDNDFNGAADDGTFHGTFAASCAAAAGNDGTGMAGAAWGCRIMAVKTFTDDGGASFFDLANAVVYASDNGADIINMSLGGPFSSTMQNAVNYGHGAGVVQIASAGNGNSSSQQYPAAYNHVVSVGASDSGSVLGGGSGDIDGRASFSQYGSAAVDVVAPGSLVVGASVGTVATGDPAQDFWILASGTSFSAPIVAGLAGLVKSRALDLGVSITNDDIESILQTTTNDLPNDPNDVPNGGANWDGLGRVDFEAAVLAVDPPTTNNPPVADAGPSQSGLVGDVLTFDGTGSFDPDSDPIVSYVWDFGDGTSDTGAVVTKSYGNAGSYLVTLTVSDGSLTGNDATTVTISDPPTGGPVALMASRGNNSVAGVGTVRNEDIVEYDPGTGSFVLVFDGSDVGLASAAIDALHVEANGDIVLSFTGPFSVPGLVGGPSGTSVDDSDLVTFTPSLLGPNTSGVFTFLFDGSDVGLTANGEDVDGVSRDGAGNLMISTVGSMSGTGASGRDEDVFRFTSSSLGATTAGSFALRFDGSDMGLANGGAEDVDAIHVDGSSSMYLSTVGAFSASGLSGGDEDVSLFTGTFGGATSGSLSLWFDGSAAGLPGNWDVAGLCIQ